VKPSRLDFQNSVLRMVGWHGQGEEDGDSELHLAAVLFCVGCGSVWNISEWVLTSGSRFGLGGPFSIPEATSSSRPGLLVP
jgi:hypothetical protein